MNRLQILGLGLAGGLSAIAVAPAQAAEFDLAAAEPTTMDQVTSVSQLSDVKPTDWAFQALQSLVERYGCIAGYPDRTYRGNRALTRYEFAAGLNACLDRVNELIAAGTANLAKKEDLAALQKLQEQFAAELATLRGRVDGLDKKVATLEKQQFSTTTKLNAEVVVGIAGVAGGREPGFELIPGTFIKGDRASKNTVLGYRARLNLDTSFTGKDLLRTRLQAGNSDLTNSVFGDLPEGALRFAADSNNGLGIDALLYQFPLGEKTNVTLEANAGAIDDFTDTLNPYLDGDGGSGALTHFGTRNPIYYLLGGAGVGVRHNFSDKLELSAGYLAGTANDPSTGNGLFNGSNGAIAQITFKPSDKLKIGATYVKSYKNTFENQGSPTGSFNANLTGITDPFSSNSFGLGGSFAVSPQIVLNASAGYTKSKVLKGTKGDLDIWNWSIGLALPDLGKKGNLAGIIVGMEPKVTGTSSALRSFKDRNTSLHVEGFYQYAINDKVSITPGFVWLTAPNHDNRNDDNFVGTIRTTFTF
ncbi:MAG: iron uptake porin [Alkalinema sp. RU_4_3]|nr:iron uptake porin [Alkalinema sp. RU_4_3]